MKKLIDEIIRLSEQIADDDPQKVPLIHAANNLSRLYRYKVNRPGAFTLSRRGRAEVERRGIKLKLGFVDQMRAFFWELRAKYSLRELERELDRWAAGIRNKEEQRADREAWLREAGEKQ